ncbi:MAG: PAC2 family protein [Desulfobacteraceae bacterium]|nr:PAC2 family protein [Desulfobacteraceae bacterium]
MAVKKIDPKREIITLNLHHEPDLREPYMIAAWSGMGNVGFGAAKYLKEKLGSEIFGEIHLTESFRFSGVSVTDNGTVESPMLTPLPSNKFYCWKNRSSANDIIIFLGEIQPSGMEYELAHKVIEVGEKFKVKRIYTAAAFALPIQISQESKVHYVATNAELIEELKGFDLKLMTGGSISGLNGFLLGLAKEKGIEGICLLGEMPNYLTHIEYPKASYAVLSILIKILNINIDLNELLAISMYQEEEIKKYIKKIEEQVSKLQQQQIPKEEKPKVLH